MRDKGREVQLKKKTMRRKNCVKLCDQVNTCHSPGLKERFVIEDTAIILFRDSTGEMSPLDIKIATSPSP